MGISGRISGFEGRVSHGSNTSASLFHSLTLSLRELRGTLRESHNRGLETGHCAPVEEEEEEEEEVKVSVRALVAIRLTRNSGACACVSFADGVVVDQVADGVVVGQIADGVVVEEIVDGAVEEIVDGAVVEQVDSVPLHQGAWLVPG